MNKNIYKQGRAYEYRLMQRFESKGWQVIRSAGSHTPIDLVVFVKPIQHPLLIQCKYSTSMPDLKAMMSDENISKLQCFPSIGRKIILHRDTIARYTYMFEHSIETGWRLLDSDNPSYKELLK